MEYSFIAIIYNIFLFYAFISYIIIDNKLTKKESTNLTNLTNSTNSTNSTNLTDNIYSEFVDINNTSFLINPYYSFSFSHSLSTQKNELIKEELKENEELKEEKIEKKIDSNDNCIIKSVTIEYDCS